MELIAKNNNVKFISPLDLLCDEKGCLISTSSQTLIPLAWDYGHLTEAGSEFLIAKAVKKNLISFSK
jgi:SGNH domain (fused to AT3 domains)